MQERKREVWAHWEELLAEQAISGLSVAAFCQEHRLTDSQFYSWKRRLRAAAAEPFVEVQVVSEEPTAQHRREQSQAIEIRLEGGRQVFVEPGFDAAHLRAVVEALEGQA
jgi:transposase-like protein